MNVRDMIYGAILFMALYGLGLVPGHDLVCGYLAILGWELGGLVIPERK